MVVTRARDDAIAGQRLVNELKRIIRAPRYLEYGPIDCRYAE